MSVDLISITPAILKFGTLISFRFRAWTATVTLKEKDEVLTAGGTDTMDKEFFKRGSISLIPSREMKDFGNRRGKFEDFLSRHSTDFPIPHARLIFNQNRAKVVEECRQCAVDINLLRDGFAARYPALRSERIARFNEKHPQFAGRLDRYFPPVEEVRHKFGFERVFYEVKDVEALDKIMEEERDEFRSKMRNYTHEMARNIRKSAVEAALAFKKGMDRAKHVVDSRAVESFKEFLERFESEEFMGDKELRDVISNMKAKVFAIDQWNTEDKESMDLIRGYLGSVVALGEDEGAMAEVARSFVREQTGADVSFEIPASTIETFDRDVGETPSITEESVILGEQEVEQRQPNE